MNGQKRERAAEWLARAQQQPQYAWNAWSRTGVAVLPLGPRFVTSRLSEKLVYAAVGSSAPGEVAVGLERLLNGPVIFDGRRMGGTYYPLMSPLGEAVWEHQDVAPLLAEGTYLGVPRLDRREPPGTFWVVPPRTVGDVCEPDAVRALIALACTATRETEQ
ncbi:hypothetical protein ACGFSB_36175 [Streptomyces sp. NPDC048441]|uniref:hypothetical protein n=1 Tax=Streptomyces sp. NPDC048441 TaxID=3365552 RepID=UPI0037235E7D